MRAVKAKVHWYKLLWGSLCLPWLAIFSIDWELKTDKCIGGMELILVVYSTSRPWRLGITYFFTCPITNSNWVQSLSKTGVTKPVMDWAGEFQWAKQYLPKKCTLILILRLARSAYIYQVWRERNPRTRTNHIQSVRIS